VVLAPDGSVTLAAGQVGAAMFPRSSNKPMQAAAMLACGLNLSGRLLALAAASHSGEEFHVAAVREVLAGVGLDESALQCPLDLPLDDEAKRAVLAAGGGPDRVHMNCSGKHAAMLATCVAAGWPIASYRDPAHPLQVRIREMLERLAAERVARTGVDGCGAPLFAISLTGLARAFRALVLAGQGTPERAVADAMRAFPSWTSGTTRPEAELVGAVPGLLMKSGAEGVCAFALADGRAAAVKVDDGGPRAVIPLMAALLWTLLTGDGPSAGTPPPEGAPAGQVVSQETLFALERAARSPVTGGGDPVGEIRVILPAHGRR
jgi:L-asparaginase II